MSFISDFWDDNGDAIVDFLIRLGTAIVVLIIGIFLIKWITKLLHKVFAANKKLDPTVAGFFESIARFALRFILLIIVFDQLGIENTAFIAIAGASVFALAFALQGSLSNLAAGALLLSFRYIKVGDLVEVAGEFGFVRRIEMFTSEIVTPNGKLVYIPNGSVTANNIANLSALGQVRLQLVCGIGYEDDVHLARRVAMDVLKNNRYVLQDPAPSAVVIELGDNSVNMEMRPWVEPSTYFSASVQILEEIFIAFTESGLNIPYPQRDVHLNLVDTPEGDAPKSYPNWVPLKKRPGGADRFFHRIRRENTKVMDLLHLSDADKERLAEEEEADREAGIVRPSDDAHPSHFAESSSSLQTGADDDEEESEAPPPVMDLDAELENGDIAEENENENEDEDSDEKADGALRLSTGSSSNTLA